MFTEKNQHCADILGYSSIWLLVYIYSGECNMLGNAFIKLNSLRQQGTYHFLHLVFALYERKN